MSIITDVAMGETSGDVLIDAISNEVNPEIVKKKPEEIKVDPGPLDCLVKFNDWLEEVTDTINNLFDNINTIVNGVPQAYIDAWCRRMAWRLNMKIERKRQEIVTSMYQWNGFVKGIIMILVVGMSVVVNPLGAIASFFELVVKPYAEATNFITTLMTEIPRLGENLTNLANTIPPEPINPDISFDEFINNIEIGKIDVSYLTAPPDLPPPEEMFPEPPRVWGKGVFNAYFETGTEHKFSKDKTKKIKYTGVFAENTALQEQLSLEGLYSLEGMLDSTNAAAALNK